MYPSAEDPLRAPKVLLVDDDEVNLLLTSTALRERGFAVTEVTSGRAALRSLGDWSPDVLVLDALMPELDGFETCRHVRHMPGFEMLPVLMLTGLDDDASITRAYDAGATDFFVKSTQWSLLAGRLLYLLRSSHIAMELERNRSKLARAQHMARMGSFDWRVQGGFQMSPEGITVLGLVEGNTFNMRTVLRMLPPEERGAFWAMASDKRKHASVFIHDLRLKVRDGRQLVIHIEAEPEFSEQGTLLGYTGVGQDVTERKAAEDESTRLANFDSLTGLPNRVQLGKRADRALEFARRQNQRFSLLLIDLDRFKVINDTLGHGSGDILLKEVARRLKSCVRHSDDLVTGAGDAPGIRGHRSLEAVARLGGDEFVALLPEIHDQADAKRVADRILETMRDPITIGGHDYFVTASVGIATYPDDGTTVTDLLRNADVAMYAVKASGRNASLFYTPGLSGRGREKLELESALHKAIEREELVLHYQPKVDVPEGRVLGVEALMRWHRNGTLVPPADFIPLAEETGLIVPMSEWAIREAARQVRRWRDRKGFDTSIAVNLPSRVFERSDLVEHIQQASAQHGVSHRAIELEITETVLMKDLQEVIPALHRLNQIGVEISIDDFGTGYSSLAYLTSLPISELKVDRSFIRDLGVTVQSRAVVTAIIALARSLGLRVIAEGVENLRQMNVLHELGCGLMQGFLFARPMPAHEVERWLEDTVAPRRAPWFDRAQAVEVVEPDELPPNVAPLARRLAPK